MEQKKVKIGVLGAGRGMSMIGFCKEAENVELVAVCDNFPPILERAKQKLTDYPVTFYDNFDEFITHDMDAVVLANYATEHAPFAIRCMKAGKHVYSEVLPCQTMKEAVELVETVEETGMIYAYGENYCYMGGPKEMRRRYKAGDLGEIEYAEGEYLHNCEEIWHSITYGDPDHWRNHLYSTFYCTHSLGPLIHICGLRPVKVSGFETPFPARHARVGLKSGAHGMEIVTLENGAILKSVHGYLAKDSVWFSVYGTKGRMETARNDTEHGKYDRIYENLDSYEGEYDPYVVSYLAHDELTARAKKNGHGGSDFYAMYNFVQKLQGNEEADTIDVYEAMDMYLPGMFAYRSILAGGQPMDIPNLREKADRDRYRNDTMCTDPKVAGDQWIPSYSKGDPDIPMEVYENMRRKFEEGLA